MKPISFRSRTQPTCQHLLSIAIASLLMSACLSDTASAQTTNMEDIFKRADQAKQTRGTSSVDAKVYGDIGAAHSDLKDKVNARDQQIQANQAKQAEIARATPKPSWSLMRDVTKSVRPWWSEGGVEVRCAVGSRNAGHVEIIDRTDTSLWKPAGSLYRYKSIADAAAAICD